tara:strand:- start:309 stop:518 length:210 start_codon:yes stop_codon:yes gene_type:complete
MSNKKKSSLEKIGYLKSIPKNSDLHDYESIIIKKKNGQKCTLYRNIQERPKFDEINNFKSSWKTFNDHL